MHWSYVFLALSHRFDSHHCGCRCPSIQHCQTINSQSDDYKISYVFITLSLAIKILKYTFTYQTLFLIANKILLNSKKLVWKKKGIFKLLFCSGQSKYIFETKEKHHAGECSMSCKICKSFCFTMVSAMSKSTVLKLTHWGRATHICVGKLTIIVSDNGLSPGRRQAIIWTNAGILLIGPLGTNFSEILIGIQTFSFKKMHLKMSSAKWRPFVSASMC